MIDRAIEKERVKHKLKSVYVDHEDLKKVELKIELCKEVIKELKVLAAHSKGISKVLVEWQLESYETQLIKFEILHEITRERFLELN